MAFHTIVCQVSINSILKIFTLKMALHRWTGSATFSSAATAWSSSSLRRSPPNIPTNSSRFESMKKYKYKHLYSWMRSGSMSTTPCSTCPRSTCSLVSSTISRRTRITRSACFSRLFTDLQEIQLVNTCITREWASSSTCSHNFPGWRMGSWQVFSTCPSSPSSKMCVRPSTMFTWRSDFCRVVYLSNTMDFSGKPETENLRRPCQVCKERWEAAAGAAFALKIHPCAENQFAGVVQFAEVRSKNFSPHKQWLGVHKSGAGGKT